jgi:hypothetical protein
MEGENNPEMRGVIEAKLQSVFKDFSTKIFKYNDEQVETFIKNKYRPRCEALFADDESNQEMLDDNLGTPDFTRFVQAVIKLQLHMVLSDPPIELSMLSVEGRAGK